MWKLLSMEGLSSEAIRVLLERDSERKCFIIHEFHPDFTSFMLLAPGDEVDFTEEAVNPKMHVMMTVQNDQPMRQASIRFKSRYSRLKA